MNKGNIFNFRNIKLYYNKLTELSKIKHIISTDDYIIDSHFELQENYNGPIDIILPLLLSNSENISKL